MIASQFVNDNLNQLEMEIGLNFTPFLEKKILDFNNRVFVYSGDMDFEKVNYLRNALTLFAFWDLSSIFPIKKSMVDIPFNFFIHQETVQYKNETCFVVSINDVKLLIVFNNGFLLVNENFNFNDYITWRALDSVLLQHLHDWIQSILYNLNNESIKSLDFHHKEAIKKFMHCWLDDIKVIDPNIVDNYIENTDLLDLESSVEFFALIKNQILYKIITKTLENSVFYYPEKALLIFWDGWQSTYYNESYVVGFIKAKNIYHLLDDKNEYFYLGDTNIKCINLKYLFTDNLYKINSETPLDLGNLNYLKLDEHEQFLFPVNCSGISLFRIDNLTKAYSFKRQDTSFLYSFSFKFSDNKILEIEKKYNLKKVINLSIPTVIIWPNYQSEIWKNYFVYYDLSKKMNENCDIKFFSKNTSENIIPFEEEIDKDNKYRIVEYDTFPGHIIEINNKKDKVDYGFLELKWKETVTTNLKIRHIGIDYTSRNFSFYYFDSNDIAVIKNKYPINPFLFKNLHLFLIDYNIMDEVVKRRISLFFIQVLNQKTEARLPVLMLKYKKLRKNLSFIDDVSLVFDLNSFNNLYTNNEDLLKNDSTSLNQHNLSFIKNYLKLLFFFITAQSVSDGIKSTIYNISYPSCFSSDEAEQLKIVFNDALSNIPEYYNSEISLFNQYINEDEAISKYFYEKKVFFYDPKSLSIILNLRENSTSITVAYMKEYQNTFSNYGSDQIVGFIKNNPILITMLYTLCNKNITTFSMREPDFSSKFINYPYLLFSMIFTEIKDFSYLDKYKENIDFRSFIFYIYLFYMALVFYASMFFCRFLNEKKIKNIEKISLFIAGEEFLQHKRLLDFYGLDLKKPTLDLVQSCLDFLLINKTQIDLDLHFSTINENPQSFGVLYPLFLSYSSRHHSLFISGETDKWQDHYLDILKNEINYIEIKNNEYFINFLKYINLSLDIWYKNFYPIVFNNRKLPELEIIDFNFLQKNTKYFDVITKIRSDVTLKNWENSYFITSVSILLEKIVNILIKKV